MLQLLLIVGVILALEWLAAVVAMVRQSFDLTDLRFFSKGVFASLRRTIVVRLLLISLYRGLSSHREGTL